MIGKLKGMVDAVGERHVIVDVGGVGYEVQASARTLRTLQAGEDVSLAIETHVREDAIRLYGFTSEVERAWFRTLQTIQGVGAKVALAVLGTLSPQDLANAIALQNWAAVEQSPGVGKKLAQRIVAELKDKAPALSVAGLNVPAAAGKGGPAAAENNAAAEAISALTNLGYQPGAGQPGHRRGHEGAGRGGRYAQADPPRPQGAGAIDVFGCLPAAMRMARKCRLRAAAYARRQAPMQIYLPVAELSLNVFLLLGLGLAIGFLSGMFGVGGGFIMTPLLIFLGVPAARGGRHGGQPGRGRLRLQRGGPLAARQHRHADGLSADRRRRVRRHHRRQGRSTILKQLGQLDLFVSLTYVILLGVIGALMLIESVQTSCAPARARPARRGAAASTPGSRACRSSSASGIRRSTSAPFRRSRSAPSSAG